MPEQQQKQRSESPAPWNDQGKGPFDSGPRSLERPDVSKIVKKLVSRDQAQKYRQRSGE